MPEGADWLLWGPVMHGHSLREVETEWSLEDVLTYYLIRQQLDG